MTEVIPLFVLAKVIIAAAWADGSLSPDEVISVKHMLLRVRNLTVGQWQTLEIYLDSPVDEAERARLVGELKAITDTPEMRQAVFESLDDVIRADGNISPQEEQVLAQVKAALAQDEQGFFSGLRQLMSKPKQQPVSPANNREIYLEDYVKNRVYYRVERRTGLNHLNIPDGDLRRLCLIAGLVARVAMVTEEVSEEEFGAIVNSLETTWGANRDAATLVAEIATTESLGDMEYRMETEIQRLFTYEERVQLLDVLFAVALADGDVSSDEMNTIRTMATMLRVTQQEFVNAKLKIPADKRGS